ncbi:cystathionine gamma-synthase [Amycolatopsis bartoniae]|uniref:Cystathionine gamma-synthase n=1 Tax=Amycolatopsis bartoniae TaxID=941986 RepID=A0A8H9IVD4_9PSEU|nr:PLP-dependent transferase [Amycolatopsis bartoniae]MBB2933269.1 cystathionine gamma-synthase [Amycolatopsis bartoniae]TVS99342.1 PLP-dependent transferase [Amycolatopsis bartoniae]GHF58286.1 cystathionine gamma-synthase [Amycolatopsis bartoniae]
MDWSLRTRAIAAGRPTEPGEPLNTPIVPTSTYVAGGGFTYARESGTPTWEALEEAVGALEGGRATAFASGIGAIAAAFDLFPIGARVAVPTFSYSGTRGLLEHAVKQGRFTVRQLDPEDVAAWEAAADEVDVLWVESPTNPMLHLIDFAQLTGRHAKVVVDNTFATPLAQRPLEQGADVVVHSATKLIGGHSDLLLGLTVARDETLAQELRDNRTRTGATPGALEAWLALRGLRTMPVRLAEQSKTAALLAERLSRHEAVTRVRYPGQGMMIAFELADAAAADRFCAALELIVHATSLGGVESLVERRGMYALEAHVPQGLIRFSVGLEDPEDLWRDLSRALG